MDLCQSVKSQQFCSHYDIDNVYCISCNQLYVTSCSRLYDTDYKVLDNCVLDKGDNNHCVDNNKVLNININKQVLINPNFDPVHEVYHDHLYKTQRQTTVPYITYCSTPCQLNYVYDTKECVALLVLKNGSANSVCYENKSAVSQCCKVSLLQYYDEYTCTYCPVLYIQTEFLKHNWYQYRGGYYGLPCEGGYYGSCSLHPIQCNVVGALLIIA